ncbi:MAG: hypothetical protein NVS3B21_28380 [Acidimicrobiales bacterium]
MYEVRYDHGPVRVRATDSYELTIRLWHDGTPGRTLTASVPVAAVVTAPCDQDARFWAAFALIAANRLFTEDEDDDDGDGGVDLPDRVEFGEAEVAVVCEIVNDDIVLPGLIADRAVLRSWV